MGNSKGRQLYRSKRIYLQAFEVLMLLSVKVSESVLKFWEIINDSQNSCFISGGLSSILTAILQLAEQ